MSSIKVNKPTKDKGGKANQVANGTTDNKNQPTAEQLRIARMTADKTDADPEMMKKIKEVSDLTGRSADEAYTALHDCNGDANQAVDLLFEKTNNQDEWHEMRKKKKQPTSVKADTPTNQTENKQQHQQPDKSSDNWECSESLNEINTSSGRGRRGSSRFGRGRGIINGNREGGVGFGSSDRPGIERNFDGGNRGRRRGGSGGGGARSAGRNFRERDHSSGFDSNNSHQQQQQQHHKQPPHLQSQQQNIDTWSNSIAENGKVVTENWNNDDWTNTDDWDGTLEESLVLTRTPATNQQTPVVHMGSYASGSNSGGGSGSASHLVQQLQQDALHLQQQQQQQQIGGGLGGIYNTPHSIQHHQQQQQLNFHHQQQQQHHQQQQQQQQLSYQQQQQIHHQQQQSIDATGLATHARGAQQILSQSSASSSTPSSAYMSHYAKEATECIKNAVGIGPNSNAQQHQQHQQQHVDRLRQEQQNQYYQHIRPKIPPPSKIPQSAVEMPGSMRNMQLDVQFGNWDTFTNCGLSMSSSSSAAAAAASSIAANLPTQQLSRQAALSSSSVDHQDSAIAAKGSVSNNSSGGGGHSGGSGSGSNNVGGGGINLQQFMSTGLTAGQTNNLSSNKHHQHHDASNAMNHLQQHQQQQQQNHSNAVEMMATNRLLQQSGRGGVSIGGNSGTTPLKTSDVISSGHMSQYTNSLADDKKSHHYYGSSQQAPAGFSQLQQSTQQSLLSSTYQQQQQQQQQQHIGLGSLGLSSIVSHNSAIITTTTTASSYATSTTTLSSALMSSSGNNNMSFLSSSMGYSMSPPSSTQSPKLAEGSLTAGGGTAMMTANQMQYHHQYSSGRGGSSGSGGNNDQADSMAYQTYNNNSHHHQFQSKNYASDGNKQQQQQPSSSLNFENSSMTSNLYHQQTQYNHSSSSGYPTGNNNASAGSGGSGGGGSNSGNYLGGNSNTSDGNSSSFLPSNNANIGSYNHNSGSFQSGSLSGGSGVSGLGGVVSGGGSNNAANVSSAAAASYHYHQNNSSTSTTHFPSTTESVFQNNPDIMHYGQFRGGNSGSDTNPYQRSDVGSQSNVTGLSMQQTNKLVSEMAKLGLKDTGGSSTSGPGNQFDIVSSMMISAAASLTTTTSTAASSTSSANNLNSISTTSNSSSSSSSLASSLQSSLSLSKPSSMTQLTAGAKSSSQAIVTSGSKQMLNYPGSVNYMISQPPGFQLAPFGYPHAQQTLSQYGYDDVQIQSQRFNGGAPYYDFQTATALQGRSEQQLAGVTDSKLASMETTPTGNSLQQPASGSASQQFHAAFQQPGYGYYYPNQNLMPYYSMIPMGGMQAVPMATNPAHQGSAPSSQYQQGKQGNVYGSHAFNIGGQPQDFTKAFSNPQQPVMTTKSVTGSSQANHGDMLLTSGSGFSKQHVQGFDKANYHGATPPPTFNLTVPVCSQSGSQTGGQAMYGGGPYIPMMGHPSHSQMIHHTMVAQDLSGGNRGSGSGQPKVGSNKQYNPSPYWSAGN